MSPEAGIAVGVFCAIFLLLIAGALVPEKAAKLLAKLGPPPETPPDPPKYYAFTVMSEHGGARTMYIMGDHPLLWIEHERRRARKKYDLLAVYEMDRQLWDAIEEKTLVEIDDAPLGTRRRPVRSLP